MNWREEEVAAGSEKQILGGEEEVREAQGSELMLVSRLQSSQQRPRADRGDGRQRIDQRIENTPERIRIADGVEVIDESNHGGQGAQSETEYDDAPNSNARESIHTLTLVTSGLFTLSVECRRDPV